MNTPNNHPFSPARNKRKLGLSREQELITQDCESEVEHEKMERAAALGARKKSQGHVRGNRRAGDSGAAGWRGGAVQQRAAGYPSVDFSNGVASVSKSWYENEKGD